MGHIQMNVKFYPPTDNKNSLIVLNTGKEICLSGSFVFFDNKKVVSCCEDVYRKSNGDIMYSGSPKWKKVSEDFERKITVFSRSEAFVLPCGDVVLCSDRLNLLIFADGIENFRPIEFSKKFPLTLMPEDDNFSLFSIKDKTISEVFESEYDLFCPIVILFDEDNFLNIYCFWKLLTPDNEIILTSYELRDKKNPEPIKKFHKIVGHKIKDIYFYNKFIYILTFENGYELYIYVDNRFKNMPQMKVFNGFNVNKLKYEKGNLVYERYSLKE